MGSPRVSFVVPCYRLAHLLGECVESILAQTYGDHEILLMDDCSPDETREVARSFRDPRVNWVRNEVNLGHLANYNKGIGLARGEYIWLISADDRLRRAYVLERYVDLMDAHQGIGYTICPAVRFREAGETVEYGSHGREDAIFKGRTFLRRLLAGNGVCAPSGMVRRQAYERVGAFPLDMPFAGDWWLWCAFAFHFDVGYFAEAMVGWRDHELNMTKFFKERAALLVEDEFRVLWRVHALVEEGGDAPMVRACRQAIADRFAMRVVAGTSEDRGPGLTVEEFEAALARQRPDAGVAGQIRARVYAALGDSYYEASDLLQARECYHRAVQANPRARRTQAKSRLVRLGQVGRVVRDGLTSLRDVGRALGTRQGQSR